MLIKTFNFKELYQWQIVARIQMVLNSFSQWLLRPIWTVIKLYIYFWSIFCSFYSTLFINLFLLGKHVVFGKVTPESMGTLRKIEGLGTPSGKTKTKVTITASEVTGMDDLEIPCDDMEI